MKDPFNASAAAISGGVDLILVNGRTFTVARPTGSISEPSDGTIFEDLRITSKFDFAIIDQADPHPRRHLSTACPAPFHAVSTFQPDPRVKPSDGEPTEYYVHRQWVGRGTRHDIEIHNAAPTAITRTVHIRVGADFAHLFGVKAGHPEAEDRPLEISDGGLAFHADGTTDSVRIGSNPPPDRIDPATTTLSWELTCGPRDSAVVSVTFEPHWEGKPAGLTFEVSTPPPVFRPRLTDGSSRAGIVTTDQRLARTFERCLDDLASLRIVDPIHPERVVIAAGAPWFMTLFGRDALLTSWMALPFEPDLAVGVLFALAELQGSRNDAATEEQPGKILHELRRHSAQNPFGARGRYYGTVDATPLFVMLAAETRRWGHLDTARLHQLWPHIRAAVCWILDQLSASATGFVAYQRSTGHGLLNQGWKDSGDGITYADGRTPHGSIALVEVQGYAYAALRGAAELAEHHGDPDLDPDHLRHRAALLKDAFNTRYWLESRSSFALGIDESGEVIDAITTNPGHALWTGIAEPELATSYVDACLRELWTGWGLRTLSPAAGAYNPVSYHNGSVWPHDTAIVAAGARRYGCTSAARTIIDGALDAAEHFDGRPPELFAGIARSDIPAPVTYPGSCSPQAWASASSLLNLATAIELAPPISDGGIPQTGTRLWPEPITIAGLRVGDDTHSLTIA